MVLSFGLHVGSAAEVLAPVSLSLRMTHLFATSSDRALVHDDFFNFILFVFCCLRFCCVRCLDFTSVQPLLLPIHGVSLFLKLNMILFVGSGGE